MTTPKQTEELRPCRLCLGGHTRYVPDKLTTALIHHCAYTDKELPRTIIRIDAKDRMHCLEVWNKQNAQPDPALAQKAGMLDEAVELFNRLSWSGQLVGINEETDRKLDDFLTRASSLSKAQVK